MTIIAIVDTILWTLALLGALFFLGIVVAGVGYFVIGGVRTPRVRDGDERMKGGAFGLAPLKAEGDRVVVDATTRPTYRELERRLAIAENTFWRRIGKRIGWST